MGEKIDYGFMKCKEEAKKMGLSLEDIFKKIDKFDVKLEFILCYLANEFGLDCQPNIVEGTYTSVWEGEGEITSKALINLNTREVKILEAYDPSDCINEDGDPFECENLEREYVTVNGIEYPCHNIDEDEEVWSDIDGWTSETGYYYC